VKPQLNITYFVLAGIIVIACGFLFITYGWISFATFTQRPGLHGSWYFYYRVDRIVFGIYNLIIATGALLTIMRLTYFAYKKDKPELITTYIHFAILFSILIMAEIYLNTRYVGKG
jgi:hypothetical protein